MREMLLLVALGVAACGSTPKPVERANGPGSLTLLDSGAEPRQLLRIEPVLHELTAFEMTQQQTFSTGKAKNARVLSQESVVMPTVKLHAHAEAIDRTGADSTRVESSIDDVVAGAEVATLDARARSVVEAVRSLKGSRVSYVLAANGARSQMKIAPPTGAPADVNSQVTTYADASVEAPPFPSMPVGVGAKWRFTSTEKVFGVSFQQTVTYRVRDITDAHVVLDFDGSLEAMPQVVSQEPNATTRITSAGGSLVGSVEIPLHGLVGHSEARSTYEFNMAHEEGRVRTVTSYDLTLSTVTEPLTR